MDAEQIVRALAARPEPLDESGECGVCWGNPPYPLPPGVLRGPTNHTPDCPWRLAREWVAAHPA